MGISRMTSNFYLDDQTREIYHQQISGIVVIPSDLEDEVFISREMNSYWQLYYKDFVADMANFPRQLEHHCKYRELTENEQKALLRIWKEFTIAIDPFRRFSHLGEIEQKELISGNDEN